jgi:hypothetical protein
MVPRTNRVKGLLSTGLERMKVRVHMREEVSPHLAQLSTAFPGKLESSNFP